MLCEDARKDGAQYLATSQKQATKLWKLGSDMEDRAPQ